MNHPLHLKIGKCLKELDSNKYQVILDKACGGDRRISLYMGKDKARNIENICDVDALIIERKTGRVIAVIEIEESKSRIEPTCICGKLLASALARYFIHEGAYFPLENLLFIHVLKTPSKEGSTKKAQVENLVERINNSGLLLSNVVVLTYEVIWDDESICESIKDLILKFEEERRFGNFEQRSS